MTLSQEKLDYLIAEAEKRGELRERERSLKLADEYCSSEVEHLAARIRSGK